MWGRVKGEEVGGKRKLDEEGGGKQGEAEGEEGKEAVLSAILGAQDGSVHPRE